MSDPVVKARLEVESEGSDAFDQAAEQIKATAAAAAGSRGDLQELADGFRASVEAAEGLGAAKEPILDLAKAVQDLSKAEGIDEQVEALDRAIDAWKRYGEAGKDVLDTNQRAAEQYYEALGQLEQAHQRLTDPLAASTRQAEEASKSLKEALEGSFEGAEGKAATLKSQIDRVKEALERARQEGDEVGAGQIAQLEQLEKQYADAVQAITRFGASKKEAQEHIRRTTDAVRDEAFQVSGLGDILERVSPKWAQVTAKAGAYIGALTAGWEAGEKLRAGMNQLTEGGFDRFIQKVTGMSLAMEHFVVGTERVATANQTLANQGRIFESLGLEGFSQDLERNAQILEDHFRKVGEAKSRLDAFSSSIGLSRRELDEQSTSLARNIAAFAEANQQLSAKDLGAIFKAPIQTLLDAYDSLNQEMPPKLQSLARQFDIVTSAQEELAKKAEKEAKKLAQEIDKMVAEIAGGAQKSREQISREAEVLQAAIARIDFSRLKSEQLDVARQKVTELLTIFRTNGEVVPHWLAETATSLGLFVAQMEVGAESVVNFAGKSAVAEDALVTLKARADNARPSIEGVGEAVSQAGEKTAGAGGLMSLAEQDALALMAAYGKTGDAAKQMSQDVSEAAGGVGEAASDVAAVGESADASAEAVSGLGESAGSAGAQIKSGLAAGAAELDTLKSKATSTAQTLTSELVGAINQVKTAAQGMAAPVLVELDRIIARAKEAQTEVEKVVA